MLGFVMGIWSIFRLIVFSTLTLRLFHEFTLLFQVRLGILASCSTK